MDHYLTLTMAGRGETLHALLEAFPADAQFGDGNVAAALAVDRILHGLLDEAAVQFAAARRLAATVPPGRRRVFDVYLAVIELPVPPDYRALALVNLGLAELWGGRPADARLHL